ncbi:MAG TPA: N-acetylmuramic acid 6-phosphate etherase [Armatimonadota bacterium]|jgi:N-acetylmuramic acid 6-phosphate etherase
MNLANLQTEARNARTTDIDTLSTLEACRRMNDEDHIVADAVQSVLPQIAAAVDLTAAAIRAGGRLIYVGAGTSGRLGVLDASECPPTFGAPKEMVVGLIAGGTTALTDAVEGVEDSPQAGAADIEALGICERDVVVGISASGRTPYVTGALDRARNAGAATIGVSNCDPSSISSHCTIAILPVTGPEVITGSTRLKAGTAQKLVLNMISTLAMVRIGKTYGNLMVDVMPTNAKLRDRARRILVTATGCGPEEAAAALQASGCRVKVATVMILSGLTAEEAANRLEEANGFVSHAIR